jgi:hypothetical protein
MPGLQVKILITLAVIAIGYAFVCNIRMSQKAGRLANWLRKERPDLWSELNPVARNWNGGLPGLKLLNRRNAVGLARFDREFERLRVLERQLVWGLVTGAVCLGLVILGIKYFGWDW